MSNTINVSLSVEEARYTVHQAVVAGSFTGILIDEYEIRNSDDKKCIVLVFEKHYYRVGNRLTLTTVIDNFNGVTRIHYVGGGGGRDLIRFDWGASKSFEDVMRFALENYEI